MLELAEMEGDEATLLSLKADVDKITAILADLVRQVWSVEIVEELATLLRVSVKHAYDLCGAGQVPGATKVGAATYAVPLAAGATLSLADLGNLVVFTGAAPATLALPTVELVFVARTDDRLELEVTGDAKQAVLDAVS